MATQADVRRIALSFPATEQAHDRFAFSVRRKGKLKGFVWVWMMRVDPKRPRVPEPGVIAVRVAESCREGSAAVGRPGQVLHRAALQRISRRPRPAGRRDRRGAQAAHRGGLAVSGAARPLETAETYCRRQPQERRWREERDREEARTGVGNAQPHVLDPRRT